MIKMRSRFLLMIICQFCISIFLFCPPKLNLCPPQDENKEGSLKIKLVPIGPGGRGPKEKRRAPIRFKRYSEQDPLPMNFSVFPKSRSSKTELSDLLDDLEITKKKAVLSTCSHLKLDDLPKDSWFGLVIKKELDMVNCCYVYKINCCCMRICFIDLPKRWPTYSIFDIPVGSRAYYAVKLPKDFNNQVLKKESEITSKEDFPFPWFCIIRIG